jgi:hypothetical protein
MAQVALLPKVALNVTSLRRKIMSLRPFGVKHFQTLHPTVSMSLAGSCFSSESALRPFHHGIRRRGGTIYWTALPSVERQVQATLRTHLIHRPARDIFPPLGGARVSSYRMCSCMVFMMLLPVPGSSGTRCRQPRCGAWSQPTGAPVLRSPFSSRGAWRSASPRP